MRRYLVVDDNLALAENMAEILRGEGAEVVLAGCGSEAVAALRTSRFDAIVTDMRMPDIGGAAVVSEARRLDPGMAAVVVTAFTADDELSKAREQGLLAVLSKPVPVARLVGLLERARRNALVLLVEDDRRLADELGETLCSHGFSALRAHSVEEAESLASAEPLAAILHMPVSSAAAARTIRCLRERFPELPIFLVDGGRATAPLGVEVDAVFSCPPVCAPLLERLSELHEERSCA